LAEQNTIELRAVQVLMETSLPAFAKRDGSAV
jgi:hypothetical protein